MNKKNIGLWAFYDFANSITIGVFYLYFSQWLVIDNHVSDIWYNLIFVGGTILLVVTAPVLGLIADRRGAKKSFLVATTLLQFMFLLITAVLIVAFPAHKTVILAAGLAFTIGNYFYQFTFTFYNAMLDDIAPQRLHGLVSGIGQFANFTGYILGLSLTLPLATGAIYLFGNHGRSQVFLPSVILFFLLVLPVLLFLKENTTPHKIEVNLKQEYKNYISSFLELVRLPGVGMYLLAYFFFNDAMLTVVNNFPIFLDQVFGVSDKVKSLIAVAIFGMAAVGALIGGWAGDKIGLKKALVGILVSWAFIFPIMGLLKSFPLFAAFCVLVGILYGATWTVTRAIMAYLSPADKMSHAFSYYSLFERFSTFAGPISWGLITTLLVHSGAVRYRIAIASMSVFILVGLVIVMKIPISRKQPIDSPVF
jgi:UMF1 family MFS transporter